MPGAPCRRAHGGLHRWNEFETLKAELSVDGAIWHVKLLPGLLADKIFEIETQTERLTITPFTAPDTAERVRIISLSDEKKLLRFYMELPTSLTIAR